jgi:ADP-heptose:LPS heptosyltransferase
LRSISCKQIADEIFAQCLAGQPPKSLPHGLLEAPCAPALFGTIVEGLADRFEKAFCDTYARLFAGALASLNLEWDGAAWDEVSLVARYERVRRPRPISGRPRRIFVLSRVTLGADVAVTSVLLAAAQRRFPSAEIVFCGPVKNYELFAGDPHIHHAPVEYRRGSLAERLEAGRELSALMEGSPGSIVIDPDSRLTQLGMLPVCAEENYYFFESRAFGGATDGSLAELAAEWAHEIIGGPAAKPFVALGQRARKRRGISVSLGVGDNPTKRLPDPFETELLKLLGETGMPLTIDTGAGGEERERVLRAIAASGATAAAWEGSFAGFARTIATSHLYVGYDSAGQHVAAACGVPLISIFAGFPCDRMFARWRPHGPRCHVIRVDEPNVEPTLARIRDALGGAVAAAAE